MDYQKEYLEKNPNMHLQDSITKVMQILQVIPKNIKFNNILDVACGAGLITIEIAQGLKPDYIEGIDLSDAMLKKARSLDKTNLVIWKNIDIFDYKTNKKFDLVFCVDILEHINDDFGFLKKISKLGHYILIRTPLENSLFCNFLRKMNIFDPWKDTENRYGHIHHYNETDLEKLFSKCNLKPINSISVPMPKRSKRIWEFFRLFFYPISIFSMDKMVKISGGFKIYFLESKTYV